MSRVHLQSEQFISVIYEEEHSSMSIVPITQRKHQNLRPHVLRRLSIDHILDHQLLQQLGKRKGKHSASQDIHYLHLDHWPHQFLLAQLAFHHLRIFHFYGCSINSDLSSILSRLLVEGLPDHRPCRIG